jgi:ureidoglycolate hydrolase
MKFNRERTAERSDLIGPADYRIAIQSGILEEVRIQPTRERGRLPYWSVGKIESLSLFDEEASHPIEVSAFVIRERAAIVDELTRHRFTHQIFIPITGSILGIVGQSSLANPDHPDRSCLEVVSVRPGEGLWIGRGTWHTLPFAFTQEVACLSVMHREDLDSYHDVRDLAVAGWIAVLEWTDPSSE